MKHSTERLGQQLGNYRLLQLLGQGGFAEVYLGEHRYLHTQAAVKILHAALANEDVEGFLREAQTVARLRHFNIVRVLDFGVEGNTPFLVMDYASHGTLRQRHPRGTRLPLPTIVTYVKQIAEALQYAHDQRLIHRDIKPENMLVGDNQEILLSDFGIALAVQSTSSQSPQNIAGSIAYMAPEQIQAHPRPASDQYALGITVYEWLSGNRPFEGAYTEIAIKHTMTPPRPLRLQVSGLPSGIEEVVMKVLAKDPHQRFPTVRAFAQALEQASTGGYTPHATLMQAASVQYTSGAALPSTTSPSSYSTQFPAQPLQPSFANSAQVPKSAAIPLASPSTSQPYPFSGLPPQHSGGVQTPPVFPYPQQQANKSRTVSRRFIVGSILGVATVSSGLTWFITSRYSGSIVSPGQIPLPGITVDPTVQDVFTPSSTALVTYRGHSDFIWAVDWSPNGKLVASASKDGTAQIWTAKDGAHLFSYPAHPAAPAENDWAYSVAWAKDSQRLATGFIRSPVTIWNAGTGTAISTYTSASAGAANSVAWSPDNKYIAAGRFDNTITIFEVATGRRVFTYTEHQDSVTKVAWSHDGQRIASGSQDGMIKVWRPGDGHLFFNFLGHQNATEGGGDVRSLAWSHDDKYIASCGNGIALVWDSGTGQTLTKYTQHTGGIVNSLGWSPDDGYLASGGNDITMHIWQPLTGKLAQKLPVGIIFGLAWSPDGTRIVTANYNKVAQVWQVKR